MLNRSTEGHVTRCQVTEQHCSYQGNGRVVTALKLSSNGTMSCWHELLLHSESLTNIYHEVVYMCIIIIIRPKCFISVVGLMVWKQQQQTLKRRFNNFLQNIHNDPHSHLLQQKTLHSLHRQGCEMFDKIENWRFKTLVVMMCIQHFQKYCVHIEHFGTTREEKKKKNQTTSLD